ncbi:MAG: efflux RND transporter periplasmic adaptor subunit [Chloroflexi bacterium]|nr:efflux RND transporter periplasmic adaptor subunit [Chloroflexota bacterium]
MKKNKFSKKIIWILLLLLVLAMAVTAIIISSNNARKAANATLQTQVLAKGDLTAIVGATGTVRANQSVTISWQTNGRIEEIKNKISDPVGVNQTLAVLAESSLSQNIILAQADLLNAQRNLDNLIDSTATIAQAQLNLADALQNYDKVRWNQLSSNTARGSNQDQIDASQAAVIIDIDKVEKAQKAYDRFSETPDSDPLKAGALSTLANARMTLDLAKLNLNYYITAPKASEISISEGKVAVAKAQLEDAQREWDRLKDGPDPEDISAAKARVSALKATIAMSTLTSPISGIITDSTGMVGDLVNAGTQAFRVDDLTHMYVDVQIPEVDINRVKVGQTVNLTFDAIPATEYEGRVTEVARIGVLTAGAVNFNVTIEVLKPDDQVLPGMTAAVNIIVSNVKNVLIIPNRAVRLVDGKRVVYLLKNNIPTLVEIEIGSSSDTLSEITSGNLQPGDTLILNPSTDITNFMSGGRPPF